MGIRLFVATLMVALCLDASARAQGSAEDYRRADRLAQELPGLVLNESIDPRWITRSKVVYRLQTAPDRARYWLMDAETLFPVPAFDHNAAARAFARGGGDAARPDRLPVVTVRASDGERNDTPLLIVLDDGRLFEVAQGGGEFSERPPEDVPSIGLRPTRVRRSSDDGGDTSLIVVNRAAAEVRMVWLDRSGGARGYGEVGARSSRRQHTFVGHVWRIENTDGESLGVYEAEHEGVNVIVINDTTPQESPDEPAEDRRAPNVSPDGRWRLEIREHNVTRIDTETGAETPLTQSGTAESPFVENFLFSPDSSRVVLLNQRDAQRRTVTLVEAAPEDQLQPKRHEFQYLKPGDRIEAWRPVLIGLETGERIDVDRALFPSPWWRTTPRWADDSSAFFFVYFERGSQARRVIRVDGATGEARAVIDEQADGTFIDGTQKTFIRHVHNQSGAGLPAHEIIWMSERSGWNHLYRIDASTGEVLNAITSGEWVVRDVGKVDMERGQIWFTAMGRYTADDASRDPYHVHFARVNFDGSGLTWLTEADGTHTLSFDADWPYYITVHSRVDRGPTHEMRRTSDGRLMATLADADLSPLRTAGWRAPERFVAKGRDGTTDIWGHIVTPSNFDPSREYPVIEHIYAGPHGNHVPKRFRAWRAVHSLAELGFVVVQIDGMGTNWRSKAFHDVAWRNVADAGFPDRIAWIEAAAADRPWMDLSRVGIYGGSAGGQNALGALLFHGDFYHAAAADCGCHDNRMDKLWWNEAWMGYPVGPHFAAQSNVTNAHKLRGKLLLTVGALDRNVDPSSTMQVVQALIEADKDFELVVFPALGHGAGDSAYGVRRRNDFFVRELLGREPRWSSGSEGDRNASD